MYNLDEILDNSDSSKFSDIRDITIYPRFNKISYNVWKVLNHYIMRKLTL